MSIGRITKPIEVAIDQPWSMDFLFWKGRAKTLPSNLASADMILRKRVNSGTKPPAITLTAAESTLSVQGNAAGPRVTTPSDLFDAGGTYDFALRVTDSEGGARQVRGVVEFEAGI